MTQRPLFQMTKQKLFFLTILTFTSPVNAFECWGRIGYGDTISARANLALTCLVLLLTTPMLSNKCFEIRKVFVTYCLFISISTIVLTFVAAGILCMMSMKVMGLIVVCLAFILGPAIYQFRHRPKESISQYSTEPWLISFLATSLFLFIVFKTIFLMRLSDMAASLLITSFAYPLTLLIQFLSNTVKFSWLKLTQPNNRSMPKNWMIPCFITTLLISYPTVLTSFFGMGGRLSSAINSTGLVIFFFAYIITLVFFSVRPTLLVK